VVLGAQIKICDEERWSNLVTNTWAWFSNSSGLVNIRLQVIGSAPSGCRSRCSLYIVSKMFLMNAMHAARRRAVIEWVQDPF